MINYRYVRLPQWCSNKESACYAGDAGSTPELGKSPGGGNSILAGDIPWTEEPGRLQSIGSQRVGHDWATEHIYIHIGKWYKHTNKKFFFKKERGLNYMLVGYLFYIQHCVYFNPKLLIYPSLINWFFIKVQRQTNR